MREALFLHSGRFGPAVSQAIFLVRKAWRVAPKHNQFGCGGLAGDLEVKVLYAGGVAGGFAMGSALTASTTGAICVGLGASTVGVGGVVCALVVVAAGSLGAGVVGGKAGEEIGDMIFELVQ